MKAAGIIRRLLKRRQPMATPQTTTEEFCKARINALAERAARSNGLDQDQTLRLITIANDLSDSGIPFHDLVPSLFRDAAAMANNRDLLTNYRGRGQ